MFTKLVGNGFNALLVGLLACGLWGCGGSGSSGGGTTKPTGTAVGDDGDGGGGSASGSTAPSARITSEACTEDNSVCTTYAVPASFTGTPTRIFVGFYKALPPAGPPDVFGSQMQDGITVTAGQPFTLKETGVTGLAGASYFIYSVLYMPGGGQFQPKAGVDYVSSSAAAVAFDGKAKTVHGLSFELAK